MADTAAHLVDHVFPVVPVRQWVLSSPFALRYKMAYDARLMSDVLNIFARAVLGHLRRRARKFLGLRDSQSGAVTFIQRFGDALGTSKSGCWTRNRPSRDCYYRQWQSLASLAPQVWFVKIKR